MATAHRPPADPDLVCADVHGTPTGAKRHHRAGETPCPACAAAYREWHRDYARGLRRITSPDRTLDPIGPARDALRRVLADGGTLHALHLDSGIPYTTLRHVARGNVDRMQRRTLARVIAACEAFDATRTAAPGATRAADVVTARLRALVDRGATAEWLAEHSGVHVSTVRRLVRGDHKRVRVATAERLAHVERQVAAGDLTPPRWRERRRLDPDERQRLKVERNTARRKAARAAQRGAA